MLAKCIAMMLWVVVLHVDPAVTRWLLGCSGWFMKQLLTKIRRASFYRSMIFWTVDTG